MAQEDLDNLQTGVRQAAPAVTAEENLADLGPAINDTANKQAAAAAGVRDAAYIDYDVALDAYAAREDIEDLAHKNARNIPTDFADADFMRRADADAQDHGSSSPTG